MINHNINKGFTLIELLVVISIIGLLSSVVLASLNGTRMKGTVAAGIQFADHTYHAFGADALLYYNFNSDSDDSITKDGSGSGLDAPVEYGSALNGRSNDTPTGIGKSFDSSNGNYIWLQGPKLSTLTSNISEFTYAVWIKPTSLSSSYSFLNISRGSNPNVILEIRPADKLLSIEYNDTPRAFPSTAAATVGQWQHIAVSIKGNAATAYINGRSVGSVTISPSFSKASFSSLTLGDGSNGLMDDSSLYTSALADAQIQSIYAEGLKNHPNLAQE